MYNIIINPQGGKGKSIKARKIVEKALDDAGEKYVVHNTEYPGHATEITRELSRTPGAKIICIGGDGSFNEILNGITDFNNVTLGLVPAGTGNDFVRASGHPTDPEAAIRLILKNNVQNIDFIDLGDKRCLNVAGAGMDVDVLERYETMHVLKGKVKYYASLFSTLLYTRWHKLRITVNGETFDRSTFMVGIGNGTCIGGGMPISPNAVPDDGKLNLVVVGEMKKSKIPFELPSFLTGKHINKPYTEEFISDEFKIEILDDSKFELDGEITDGKIFDFKCVSGTLKMFR